MARPPVLELRKKGLYCGAGRFYVDPWRPAARAVLTHAHSDHARPGSSWALCAQRGLPVFRARLGPEQTLEGLAYGERRRIGDATVTLYPAGHILGSAQVRIEVDGEVWVVSGDYKTEPDPTCEAWEPIPCHGFVTETTFGLPVYRWRPQGEVFAEIVAWWQTNRSIGRASILCAYALGKSQRLLAAVGGFGPVIVHGAVAAMNRACEEAGMKLPPWGMVGHDRTRREGAGALVLCPPSALATPWARRFVEASEAFASGWMAIRGIRRRRNVDRGFVVSDHVDWPSLLAAISATGAERVWTTHGYAHSVARYLAEHGFDARALVTSFTGGDDA